ncbi:tetratricopeptide repeat protein [Qipengyuania thermophila]|uniref:tetratricopeptide repeat protein n=1 Tax=Qipengyuania thermophila TaxID=2509361 RepID=UPI0018F86E94|nr:tetratricopeptide repeat protein [Qipengyuania thermophila]
MRFAPAAAALSLVLAMTGSVLVAQQPVPHPAASALIDTGRAALAAGQTQEAIDAFEAALVIDPAYTPLFVEMAAAARQAGMTGKAVGLYRQALARDPANLDAIAGEGAAFAEQGAVERARGNLSRLRSLCGNDCPQVGSLQGAIERGPVRPALAAETKANGIVPN